MPLPGFNGDGVLPLEIYDVSLAEIQERFGQANFQRQELFTRLSRYFQRLSRLGIARELIIDGSFVTAKQIPTDIDIIVVYREGFDFTAQMSDEERALFEYSEVKRVFGFDLFSLPHDSLALSGLISVFHKGTRLSDREKGILRLIP